VKLEQSVDPRALSASLTSLAPLAHSVATSLRFRPSGFPLAAAEQRERGCGGDPEGGAGGVHEASLGLRQGERTRKFEQSW
jgi:hypothetical protein